MKRSVKKGKSAKKYSDERINETIGHIWYHMLDDKKRKEIYKRYGETKDPNKKWEK